MGRVSPSYTSAIRARCPLSVVKGGVAISAEGGVEQLSVRVGATSLVAVSGKEQGHHPHGQRRAELAKCGPLTSA